MKMLILFIILACLTGCVLFLNRPKEGRYIYTHRLGNEGKPIREIPIWVDKNFGAGDRIAIDDAVNAWNYALNGYIKLRIVDNRFDMEMDQILERIKSNGWLVMKVDEKSGMIPSGGGKYRTVGFCERVGGNHLYLVRSRLFNRDVFGVMLHEMGHLLGAHHVGERLMHPHFSPAKFQCIDRVSLEAVANYNGIPLDRLNYCVDSPISSLESGEASFY